MQLLYNQEIVYKMLLPTSQHAHHAVLKKNIDMNHVTPLWMSKVSHRVCLYTCIKGVL